MEQNQMQTPTPEPTPGEQVDTEPVVQSVEWPPEITERPYELVTLPSGAEIRVDYQVTYGELLISSLLALILVIQVGRWLWERIRGVL